MIKQAISKLIIGENLTEQEAYLVMDEILDNGATPAQIASFLSALRIKGETIDEIVGCAKKMREKATSFTPNIPYHIDVVGTGGDSLHTFNISTCVSLVAAACGICVAKHGNRAITSRSGSADVLEELGVNITLERPEVIKCIDQTGIGFMFARVFNKKMSSVSKVRSELSIRTIFNILGPLSNPSNAKGQMVGVYDESLCEIFSQVMKRLGVENGIVICGEDGLDEISISGKTKVSEIKDGKINNFYITPEQFGFNRCDITNIRGGDAKDNANIIRDILSGNKSPKRDVVILNSAFAIYVGKKADSIDDAVKLAEQAIDSGMAQRKLNELITVSNSISKADVI